MSRIFYYVVALPFMFTVILCSNAFADPVIEWNTFLGSSTQDYGKSVATDDSGNVYMAGESEATWGTPIRPFGAVTDVAVAKFDENGVLQWNTFLGSSISNDYNASIATDNGGNVYVTGTSNNTWGSPINPPIIGANVFLAKLNSSGVLQWNTFIPGYSDIYHSIAVDTTGNIYLTGYSYDWGSPINPHAGAVDVFVAKLNSSGVLQWHTFMGQLYNDAGSSLTIDAAGNIYVAGFSQDTWGTPINPPIGADPFVAKLNANGILQWNTFIDEREIRSIATDGSNGIFVAGRSTATWGVPISPYSGNSDGFVAKLNSSGVYQWHTYMGSAGDDSAYAVSVDSSDNIYMTGDSSANWGTPINPYTEGPSSGWWMDGFVAKLDSSGVLQWNTFLGQTSEDGSRSITADDIGNIYVAGHSLGSWGTPVNPWTLYRDIFVAKIYDTDTDPPTVTSTIPLDGATDVPVSSTISATFSEDMDALTVDSNNFIVDNGVSGTIGYDTDNNTATFMSTTDLNYGTTYTATITTDVKDLTGNPLQAEYTFSFTTEPPPDIAPPTIIGTLDSGIWYWDVTGSEWTEMTPSTPTGDIAAGDFTGDGKADVASCWGSGLWYQDWATLSWIKVSGSAPNSLTAGDVTGDGQAEIIGTWSSGVWYWDVAASIWTQMTVFTPTGDIAAGDFTGDGKADVVSIWDNGLWYQDGATLDWTKVSNTAPTQLTAGDVTGDGRSEIIGTWSSGVWYWDVVVSKWTKMTASTPIGDIAAGDFTGDGKADVASCWGSGLWYQDGATLDWTKVSNTAPSQLTAGDVAGD